jgi:hypothetical protein
MVRPGDQHIRRQGSGYGSEDLRWLRSTTSNAYGGPSGLPYPFVLSRCGVEDFTGVEGAGTELFGEGVEVDGDV